MSGEENTTVEVVEALRRWQEAGGTWRVCQSNATWASVALLRCDGGEEVDRLGSGDPAWVEFVATGCSSTGSNGESCDPPGQSTTEDTLGSTGTDQSAWRQQPKREG